MPRTIEVAFLVLGTPENTTAEARAVHLAAEWAGALAGVPALLVLRLHPRLVADTSYALFGPAHLLREPPTPERALAALVDIGIVASHETLGENRYRVTLRGKQEAAAYAATCECTSCSSRRTTAPAN
jgi:hypothetical protein